MTDPSNSEYKALNHWLANLPTGNYPKTADIVAKMLVNLREQHLPQSSWLSLLERFDHAVTDITHAFRFELAHQAGALSERQQSSRAVDNLQLELADSYTDIIEQTLIQGQLSLSTIGYLAFRALYHYAEFQKWQCQLYQKLPAGVWMSINKTYQTVLKLQITSLPFVIEHAGQHCLTLETLYKQIILLASIDSGRFQAEELELISYCLSNWSCLAELDKWQGKQHTYLLDLQMDKGPIWFGQHKVVLSSQQIYCLDLKLVNIEIMRLTDVLSRLPQGELVLNEKSVTQSLLQRLLAVWHRKPSRYAVRKKQHGNVNLYYSLSPQQDGVGEQWQIINASEQGFCLHSEKQVSSDCQVGQWVSLVDAHDQHKMGLIRWLKTDVKQGVQIGLQLFSQESIMLYDIDNISSSHVAWLMSSSQRGEHGQTLLVDNTCQLQTLLNVKTSQGESVMRLGQKLERNQHYSQFQLHQLHH